MIRCLILGRGRAGASFERALTAIGAEVAVAGGSDVVDHGLGPATAEVLAAASHVLLAVPDHAIAAVARRVAEEGPTSAVVAHVSGACGLGVLAPNEHAASLHPLMSLPDAETGARRLLDGCTFAVDGDPRIEALVDALGGRAVRVDAGRRAVYHAAASVAANHLTALCAQVEVLAEEAGVPVDALWRLMSTTLDNVAEIGADAALTGPVARGDWDTVRAHLAAVPQEERALYTALAKRAADVAGREWPVDVSVE